MTKIETTTSFATWLQSDPAQHNQWILTQDRCFVATTPKPVVWRGFYGQNIGSHHGEDGSGNQRKGTEWESLGRDGGT